LAPTDISAQIARAARSMSNNQNTQSFSRIEQSNSGNNLSVDMNNPANLIQLIRGNMDQESQRQPQIQPSQISNLVKQILTQQMAAQQSEASPILEKALSSEPKEQSIGKHFFDKESSNSTYRKK
jgi:hypothetical protein